MALRAVIFTIFLAILLAACGSGRDQENEDDNNNHNARNAAVDEEEDDDVDNRYVVSDAGAARSDNKADTDNSPAAPTKPLDKRQSIIQSWAGVWNVIDDVYDFNGVVFYFDAEGWGTHDLNSYGQWCRTHFAWDVRDFDSPWHLHELVLTVMNPGTCYAKVGDMETIIVEGQLSTNPLTYQLGDETESRIRRCGSSWRPKPCNVGDPLGPPTRGF